MEETITLTIQKAFQAGMRHFIPGLDELSLHVLDDGDPSTGASGSPSGSLPQDTRAELDGWNRATAIALGRWFWCDAPAPVLMAVLFHEGMHTGQQHPRPWPSEFDDAVGPNPSSPALTPEQLQQRAVIQQHSLWEGVKLELEAFHGELEFVQWLESLGCFPSALLCQYLATRYQDLTGYREEFLDAWAAATEVFNTLPAPGNDALAGYQEAITAMGLDVAMFGTGHPHAEADTAIGQLLSDIERAAFTACNVPVDRVENLLWN